MDAALRWEVTNLSEALYALRRGLARWSSLGTSVSTRVAEKVVSGPSKPAFYEMTIPLQIYWVRWG